MLALDTSQEREGVRKASTGIGWRWGSVWEKEEEKVTKSLWWWWKIDFNFVGFFLDGSASFAVSLVRHPNHKKNFLLFLTLFFMSLMWLYNLSETRTKWIAFFSVFFAFFCLFRSSGFIELLIFFSNSNKNNEMKEIPKAECFLVDFLFR